MMTSDDLKNLYREHADTHLLSVYLDADQQDPAKRDLWRVRLKNQLSEERTRIEQEAPDQVSTFGDAADLLIKQLNTDPDSFLSGRGWVGFALPDKVLYAENLPTPMPTLVCWEKGIRVAPYLRTLKHNRPVLLALVDSREGRIYRFHRGHFEEVDTLSAREFVGATDVGTRKRPTDRTGIRGRTTTDAADAVADAARERLIGSIRDAVESNWAQDALVIVGGIPKEVSRLARELDFVQEGRLAQAPELDKRMDRSELIAEVERLASTLSQGLHASLVAEALDRAGARTRGCAGEHDTERALREGRVQTLLVSQSLAEGDPDYADRLIGTGFGRSGADAHVVTGEAGEQLDEHDGLAALLHYRIRDASE